MKVSDLQEAIKIAARISEIKAWRARGLVETQTVQLSPNTRESSRGIWISKRIVALIDREWRADLDREEADLRRRAAQISLTL